MKVGFFGCGNMGGALATAVSRVDGTSLFLSDAFEEKARALAELTGGTVCDNSYIASNCDVIFVAVKPNKVEEVLTSVGAGLKSNDGALVISMAAGVKLEKLASFLPLDMPVVRIMPNTPVAVSLGMITYARNARVDEKKHSLFKEMLTYAGVIKEVDESLIDSATAVAGCGPAFAYMFAHALAEGGEAAGLDYDTSLVLAAQMMKGAAEMVLKFSDPITLCKNVCSPGGSTIEGVHFLEDNDFESIVKGAVNASFEKTKKLG